MLELNKHQTINYSNEIVGTGYLAYRDISKLIEKHSTCSLPNLKVLDYGCGRGRSTRYLRSLGFKNIDAIDICADMIADAIKHDRNSSYKLVTPFCDLPKKGNYDFILAQLVLVEISSAENLLQMLAEQFQSLKSGGILIHTTASEELLQHSWLTIATDPNQNINPDNGCAGKIRLLNRNLSLDSWHWTEDCLVRYFRQSGFKLLDIHHPLGHRDDPYKWLSEYYISPYVTFVLLKE